MPFCTYCGQSFTRDEHLERHILTHTNVKPFKCFSCHMSFARRDLLSRHYAVHGKDADQNPLPPSDGIIPKPAGRTPIACTNCAKTKTKCDRKLPSCSRCSARRLTCVARPIRRVSKATSSVDAEPDASNEPSSSCSPEADLQSPKLKRTSSAGLPTLLPKPSPKDDSASLTEESRNASSATLDSQLKFPVAVQAEPCITLNPEDPFFIPSFLGWIEGHAEMPDVLNLDWAQLPQDMIEPNPKHVEQKALSTPTDTSSYAIEPESARGMTFDFSTTSSEFSFVTPQSNLAGSPALDDFLTMMDFEYQTLPALDLEQDLDAAQDISSGSDASALDAWSHFQCNPRASSVECPNNLHENLQHLVQAFKNHTQWDDSKLVALLDLSQAGRLVEVSEIQDWARDKLLAITQAFLHKALDIHKDDPVSTNNQMIANLADRQNASQFIVLPPRRVLEGLLGTYASTFERHYLLASRQRLDANQILRGQDDRVSSLLLLSMVNYGAMMSGSPEAQYINSGLTETCRISLFDSIEKNMVLGGDPAVLHAALLFVLQGSWSGDKWQMDIATGQRGMYTAMLRHFGYLDEAPVRNTSVDSQQDLWNEWGQSELRKRVAYSWVAADLELSIFHDTAPLLTLEELRTSLPAPDSLWQAESVVDWARLYDERYGGLPGTVDKSLVMTHDSLSVLWRSFLMDKFRGKGQTLTEVQLRLLLHPLQSLLAQIRQLHDSLSHGLAMGVSTASRSSRLEEAKLLLQRWSDIANEHIDTHGTSISMHSSFVIFQLMCLDTLLDIRAIEELARQCPNSLSNQADARQRHAECFMKIEEVGFRCDRVHHHLRAIPNGAKPLWWTAAVYRTSLILWSHAQANIAHPLDSINNPIPTAPSPGSDLLGMDMAFTSAEDLGLSSVAGVVDRKDALVTPDVALRHGIRFISEGTRTQFSDAIGNKLRRLLWRTLT